MPAIRMGGRAQRQAARNLMCDIPIVLAAAAQNLTYHTLWNMQSGSALNELKFTHYGRLHVMLRQFLWTNQLSIVAGL